MTTNRTPEEYFKIAAEVKEFPSSYSHFDLVRFLEDAAYDLRELAKERDELKAMLRVYGVHKRPPMEDEPADEVWRE